MENIIVKRPANISSQEALSHLAIEYPHSEVLSFRRVKSAGLDGDFFVATLRVAVLADEADDIVIDNEDVIVEDQKHEEEEEGQMEDQDDKLDKIIDLVEELIKKDEEVHNMVSPQTPAPAAKKPQVPLVQERPPVKNPVPMQPMAKKKVADMDFVDRPYTIEQYPDEENPAHPRSGGFTGSGSFCPECLEGFNLTNDDMRSLTAAGVAWPTKPNSYSHEYCDGCGSDLFPGMALENRRRRAGKLIVERDADVSKKRAKLELLKEFGKEYKIARLAKTGSIYSATLVKRANDRGQYEYLVNNMVEPILKNVEKAYDFAQLLANSNPDVGDPAFSEAARKTAEELSHVRDTLHFLIYPLEDPLGRRRDSRNRLASLRKRAILDTNDEDGTAGEKYLDWKAEQGYEPEAREPRRYEYYCDRCGEGESDEGEYCEKCQIEVAKEEAALRKRAEWHGLRGEQEAEINDIFNNEAQLERKRKERIKQQALEAIDRGADYDELDDIFGDEDPAEFF